MRFILVLLIAILSSLFLNRPSFAIEVTPIMPEELISHLAKNGCEQVSDFFVRPGMVNPPYIYDNSLEPSNYNAVMWCQVGNGNDRKFFMLILNNEKDGAWSECPAKIEWRFYPGELSVYNDKGTTLEQFVYLDNFKKRGPTNVKLTGKGILSEYDGVAEILYCYKGKWLIRQMD